MNNDIVELGDISFVDPCKNSVYAEKKYVEVNEAIKIIRNASPTKVWDALQVLAEMRGADVAPVRHAHWVQETETRGHCSNCGAKRYTNGADRTGRARILTAIYKYCSECGARMDEGVNENE